MIPYGRQAICDDDIEAVVEVLRGDWLTQGPSVERFEESVAEYVGTQFAIAFSSCTAALHGASWASGLGPGDTVFTSPLTFMASANAARYVGARPALVDISESTLNLDLASLPKEIDGLIPVHYAGLPVDMKAVAAHSTPRVIIEDAAHALGAQTPSGPVGNCHHSDMTCFSFHPVKPITAGEGGMVTTNNKHLADRLRIFRSHGIVRRPERGSWYYEISELGYHYRMTDIQAALGNSQLRRLDNFITERNEIAARYREAFKNIDEILPPPEAPSGFLHGYHLFPIRVQSRRRVIDFLQASGIRAQVHYVPIHHHPISSDVSIPKPGLPIVDSVYEGLLSLPIFPGMSLKQQEFVISKVEEAVLQLPRV